MTVSAMICFSFLIFFFFQAEDGIRDSSVTGVQTCALPISGAGGREGEGRGDPAVGPGPCRVGRHSECEVRDGDHWRVGGRCRRVVGGPAPRGWCAERFPDPPSFSLSRGSSQRRRPWSTRILVP